jgi:hypothetical protein
MTFIFSTKNIDKKTYEKIFRRFFVLEFGYEDWIVFNREFDVKIVPVEESEKYRGMYGLTQWNTSNSIPWGFTQPPNVSSNAHKKGNVFWFVNDTKNPFIVRQNAEKGLHEALHAGCWIVFGTERMRRVYDDPQAKAGTEAAKYVVIPHDVAYGTREKITFWIRYGLIWLPITALDVRKYLP